MPDFQDSSEILGPGAAVRKKGVSRGGTVIKERVNRKSFVDFHPSHTLLPIEKILQLLCFLSLRV